MGILATKRQQGGSLFANPQLINLGAKDYSKEMTGKSGRMPSSGGFSGMKTPKPAKPTAGPKLDGALPSDLDYYNKANASIEARIQAGLNSDPDGFEKSADYEQILRDKYALEKEMAPKLKSFYKLFTSSKSKFSSAKAGDAAAIINNQAIVQDKAGEFKIVKVDELVNNAEEYYLLKGSDVLTMRENDARFSGFTQLGQVSNQIINDAYGSESFDKNISKRLQQVGYIKSTNGYEDVASNHEINLKGIYFDQNGLIKNSNVSGLNDLTASVLSSDTNMTNYLTNSAIADIYRRSKSGLKVDSDKLGDLIARTAQSNLVKYLKISSKIEEAKNKKEGNGGTGSKLPKKDVKSNPIKLGTATLFSSPSHLTVNFLDGEDNKETRDFVWTMPSSYIQEADKLFNYGFGDNNKTDDDDDVSGSNRRILKNNSFINDAKGGSASIITGIDGTPIMNIVDNNSDELITIPNDASLHLILAPVEINEKGKEFVNFKSEHAIKIMKATEKTYDRMAEEGIDLTSSSSKTVIQRAQVIANEELAKLFKGNEINNVPVIKAALAFDVIYETDSEGREYQYQTKGSKFDLETLETIAPDNVWDKDIRRTTAFIPVADSFWKKAIAGDAFGAGLENTYQATEWRGMLGSSPKVGNLDMQRAIGSVRNAKSKKHGGKLATADEIKQLLFN